MRCDGESSLSGAAPTEEAGVEQIVGESCGQGSGKLWAAFGPVEACAQLWPVLCRRGCVDAETFEPGDAGWCELEAVVTGREVLVAMK